MNDVGTIINIELSQTFAKNNSYQNMNFTQYDGCSSHIERLPP